MAEFYRGSAIRFKANFTDADGVAEQPPGAEIVIHYAKATGGPGNDTIVMEFDTLTQAWIAIWESLIAKAGTVQYSIHTTGLTDPVVFDGEFDLLANKANMQVAA